MQTDLAVAIEKQAQHSEQNYAPATARIIRALYPLSQGRTLCGKRIANWLGNSISDAMALRLTGGLHDLYLSGEASVLHDIYSEKITNQDAVDAIIARVVTAHDTRLLPWFDGPPQTNEAGRSASFMAALVWLSKRLGPKFELNEIGSSGGLNLLIDRYRYQLGNLSLGPADSPVTIQPEWRGSELQPAPVEIVKVRGCDLNPVDLCDDTAASLLRAYIWPEMHARFDRFNKGVAMIRDEAPDLVAADAADWITAHLAQEQDIGVTRVLMHSIVWQYIPADRQAIISAAMEAAGAKATQEKPLAWIALETNRATFCHELHVRYWPGGETPVLLGSANAHGVWLEWLGV